MKKKLLTTLLCSSLLIGSTQSVAPIAAAFWAFVLRRTTTQKFLGTLILVDWAKNISIVTDPKEYKHFFPDANPQQNYPKLDKALKSVQLLYTFHLHHFARAMTLATPSFDKEKND